MFPELTPDILVHVPRSLSASNLHDSKTSSSSRPPAFYRRSGSLRLNNSWQSSSSSSAVSPSQSPSVLHHGASAEDPLAEAMASGAISLDQVLAFPIAWRNMALSMPRSAPSSPVPAPAPSPKLTQVKSEPGSSRASSSKPAASSKGKAKVKRAIKGSARAARSVVAAAKARTSPSSPPKSTSAARPSTSSSTFRSSTRPTLSLGQLPTWSPPLRHRRTDSNASSNASLPTFDFNVGMEGDDMPGLEPCFDYSSPSGNESSNGDPSTPRSDINQELSLLPLHSIALPDMDACMSWSAPRTQYPALSPFDGPALGLVDSNGNGLNPWKLGDQALRTPGQPVGWSHDWSWALDESLVL